MNISHALCLDGQHIDEQGMDIVIEAAHVCLERQGGRFMETTCKNFRVIDHKTPHLGVFMRQTLVLAL